MKLFAALLFAVSLSAQPAITAVAPGSGPTTGGTEVVITGSGFSSCEICSPPIPPIVFFGGTPAQSIHVNGTTIRATTPAHMPGTVNVSVQQHNGHATLPNAFTFTGTAEEAFDRVLLPLFTGPVPGAFGSRFITELRLANTSSTAPATLLGLLPVCRVSACIVVDPLEQPYELPPDGKAGPDNDFEYLGTPGQFLYIPKSSPHIEMNLRVYDESRSAFNFGTEMPVAYDREFTTEPIKLLGVPTDPRFRNTLRIYSTEEATVFVAFDDIVQIVTLRAGRNLVEPAYAQLSNIGGAGGTVDVTVTPTGGIPPMPGYEPAKIWAFISVTNNDTQLITTITPQR